MEHMDSTSIYIVKHLANSHFTFNGSKRVKLHGQTRNTLILQNVWERDEGYYICRVADSSGGCTFTSWAKVIVDEDYAVHGYSQFGKNRHMYD